MHRFVFVALLAAACFAGFASVPAVAVTAKQKLATCKFGADSQKLVGKRRNIFLKNCMANRNDPRGRAQSPGAPPSSSGTTEPAQQ